MQAADESVQPQALSHGESGTSGPVSSPTPAVTRNEATETGAKHSSSAIHSRSDQSTEWKMSAVEGVVLHLRSWYNYCCYCEVSEVKKCVENYCGSVWTDFSNLVGLRLSLHRKQPIKHRCVLLSISDILLLQKVDISKSICVFCPCLFGCSCNTSAYILSSIHTRAPSYARAHTALTMQDVTQHSQFPS